MSSTTAKDKNGKIPKTRGIFTDVENKLLMQLVNKEKKILELRQNTWIGI
jgi:hypothetical protein